jgi:hypothetical protein
MPWFYNLKIAAGMKLSFAAAAARGSSVGSAAIEPRSTPLASLKYSLRRLAKAFRKPRPDPTPAAVGASHDDIDREFEPY